MCLDQVKTGDEIIITNIPDDNARTHFIRFGISEGSSAVCYSKIPYGPIVIKKNRQEIAIGRELARTIHVKVKYHGDKR